MVGMSNSIPVNSTAFLSHRENVLKLMDDKNKLETDIRVLHAVLEQNGVGMDEPLVDTEGFPRNDIDVYRVRHARHSIICLRNDLKAIVKLIEEGLYLVHAAASGEGDYSSAMETNEITTDNIAMDPIARVSTVVPGSPAFICGLQSDDIIIEFGSVNWKNFNSLDDIARVVQHSVNSMVNLTIQRNNVKLPIQLFPKIWSGRGLLGCTLLPIESNIER